MVKIYRMIIAAQTIKGSMLLISSPRGTEYLIHTTIAGNFYAQT